MKFSLNSSYFISPFIYIIDLYKYFISPLNANCCRFYPSCSSYARESLINHGFLKGSFFSLIRIIKCHPFHPGGFDPVPPSKNQEKR
ncbi:MAG: membrane protein insertion efficiency factor YidD [Pelovirga sp.]